MAGSVVIVEGLERTGKTTLCKEFEKLGYVYLKDVTRTEKMNYMMVEARQDSTISAISELYKKGYKVVVDRLHLSEYAYGSALRDGHSRYLNYVDLVLSQMNSALILCSLNNDETFTDYCKRCLITYSKNDFDHIVNNFNLSFDKSEIKKKHKFYAIDEETLKETSKTFASMIDEEMSGIKYDFYLASPFFNEEQIEREERIKETLRNIKYMVYSPRENGILSYNSSSLLREKIFKENCNAIKQSKRVLAITDGKDMGTIWEAGYAYGIGKEVVYYAETLKGNPFNVMLSKSAIGTFTDFKKFSNCCLFEDFRNNDADKEDVQ